jgi:hypothetical protein
VAKIISFFEGTWHALTMLRVFFIVGRAKGLLFGVFINRLHGVFRRCLAITELDVMSFEVHHIKGDSPLQIAECLSDGYACHHLVSVAELKNIFELLV